MNTQKDFSISYEMWAEKMIISGLFLETNWETRKFSGKDVVLKEEDKLAVLWLIEKIFWDNYMNE